MNVNFELFEEGQVGRSRERLHVTLYKRGRMHFNARALEALGSPEGVALLFDRRQKIIGVMPASPDRKHAFRLRRNSRRSTSRIINAKNFCDHYSIKPTETLAFPEAAVNKDGILVLDLNQVFGVRRVTSDE